MHVYTLVDSPLSIIQRTDQSFEGDKRDFRDKSNMALDTRKQDAQTTFLNGRPIASESLTSEGHYEP